MATLTTLRRITDADIKAAALIDDLDDACRAIQQKAEIEDGGVAGHAFSDIQFDWATASRAEREDRLRAWLNLERLLAVGAPGNTFDDHGMRWDNSGKNGHYAPIRWSNQ